MLVICYVGVGVFSVFSVRYLYRFLFVCCQSSPHLPGARVSSNDICVETLQVFGFCLRRRRFKVVGDIILGDFLVLVLSVLRRSTL